MGYHTNGSHVRLTVVYEQQSKGMDGSLGESQHWSMDRTGDVRMLEYETYAEKKWLERYGIREDKVHLRETHGRVKDKQGRKHRSCKGVRLTWTALWSNAS